MTIEELEKKDLIIYKTICGSHLYGLNIETSDTDYKSVFLAPILDFCKGTQEQVNDEKNDYVSYEVTRLLGLLQSANPNILEILFAPSDKVIIKKDEFDPIYRNRDKFLTKECRNSLVGYAISQIKKAKGLNKKIVNPVEPERKGPLDFCYVMTPTGSRPFYEWLNQQRGIAGYQENYGAAAIDHTRDVYYIYCSDKHGFRGLINEDSNELRLSSIPKELALDYNVITWNKDAYSQYCKEFKEYFEWVKKRNPQRFVENSEEGVNFDRKNMMHCFRLLNMGIELAETGKLNVYRPDRDFLLGIRQGKYKYEDLIEKAEGMVSKIDEVFDKSSLPNKVDKSLIDEIIEEIRVKQIIALCKR